MFGDGVGHGAELVGQRVARNPRRAVTASPSARWMATRNRASSWSSISPTQVYDVTPSPTVTSQWPVAGCHTRRSNSATRSRRRAFSASAFAASQGQGAGV